MEGYMSRFGENGRVGGGWVNCGERDGADIWSGRWLGAESGRKMIEKVDVGNEKMYISIISVRQMEAYVKSWVSLILGVRWARKQLLVPGETAPGPLGPLGPWAPEAAGRRPTYGN